MLFVRTFMQLCIYIAVGGVHTTRGILFMLKKSTKEVMHYQNTPTTMPCNRPWIHDKNKQK